MVKGVISLSTLNKAVPMWWW